MSRRVVVRVASLDPLIVHAVDPSPPMPGDVLVTEDGTEVATIRRTKGWGAMAVNEDGNPLGMPDLVAQAVVVDLQAAQQTAQRTPGGVPKTDDWIEDVLSTLPAIATVAEVARALDLHDRTVRRAIERRELDAVDMGAGGRGRSSGRRVPRAAVADFLRRKAGLPGPSQSGTTSLGKRKVK